MKQVVTLTARTVKGRIHAWAKKHVMWGELKNFKIGPLRDLTVKSGNVSIVAKLQ